MAKIAFQVSLARHQFFFGGYVRKGPGSLAAWIFGTLGIACALLLPAIVILSLAEAQLADFIDKYSLDRQLSPALRYLPAGLLALTVAVLFFLWFLRLSADPYLGRNEYFFFGLVASVMALIVVGPAVHLVHDVLPALN